ncbi:S8 family serine peptidase [Microbacterium enclense]|uniref:S8 family serine peptidase n=1 Tax=Microbacterium enclense TaxID=993073 RepID=UPI0021A67110|nr:S8 family serine peptidase [Microbacterium enclense]MCT2085496.1 S8 family serine peptidase [Microbacterium enclense]
MGRPLRSVAVIALAGLFTAAGATSVQAAVVDEGVTPPTPIESSSGRYIVVLDEAPVATYDGGEAGLGATKSDGARLDTDSDAVREYSAFLEQRQQDVAAEVGVGTDYSYTLAVNGFSATMDPNQAAKLAATEGVQKVVPDEIRQPVAVPSTEFLGLEGDGGVWQQVGGIDAAGEGVVVGVIDTGIAPENPSFAGEPLGTTPGDEPYIDGNDVVYRKADGTDFRSPRVATGDGWSVDDYSTKLVGARYFDQGAAATGFTFEADYRSPRDGDAHGSHTASTAAGNNGVEADVEGIDFGAISGVAPAAKVAAYKACYSGPDPLVTTDDVCALSDLLGAINAAVDDGVDVINYSIGGGAATTTLALEDAAFFNAAAAGIFVAVSAGNSGPDASTADHASPWYTTVAASTIPTYEGTVTLPNGFQAAGASVSVPAGEEVTGPVVYAGDIAASGADPADAALCLIGSLDAAQAGGKIVVCDRGQNARIEKSQAVEEAGGVGMILVNVTPASVDNDFHAVPTVHIDARYRDELLAYVQGTPDATATLVGENITGEETPTPQVAGFSSRGPMLADGSDVLKPDVSAPGVAILAAAANAEGAAPTFEFLSGTSMSSPHVAGLAALYLGERPLATPAEVKSAMMTTAYDTVDTEGAPAQDPFAQGAGHVDPTRYFDPGLMYLNGPADWAAFLQGKGLEDFGVEPIDGSDLNLASISIGSLAKPQTVTRTVTSTQAGTFSASIDVPGLDATVEPSTLTFGAAGETQTFTVTFSRTTAAAEEWTTGFLTWTSGDTQVRSPIAVRPTTAEAPAEVSGTGLSGSTNVEILPGVSGDLPLTVSGLAAATLLTDPDNPVDGHSGDQDSGDADGYVRWIVDVPEGTTLSRFDLDSSDDTGSDLDLFVSRVVSADDLRYYERFTSATGAADERVSLSNPTPGTYLVEANVYSFTAPFTWDMTYANVQPGGAGELTATPNPIAAEQGVATTYELSWQGLQPETRYLGVVQYGESAVQTVLTVEAGQAAPVAVEAPTVTGTAKLGRTLTATPGTWDPAEVTTTFQWLRAGEPIEGATASTYRVKREDVGAVLSVRVTATSPATGLTGRADSAGVPVVAASFTTVTVNPWVGRSSDTYTLTVKVRSLIGPTPTGEVTVTVAGKPYTATLEGGRATITLDPQTRGLRIVTAEYAGTETASASQAHSAFIVLR